MIFRSVLPVAVLCGLIVPAAAQSFYKPDPLNPEKIKPVFITPDLTGVTVAERAEWDLFYVAYNGINYPDIAAPFGTKTTPPAGFPIPGNATPKTRPAFYDVRNPGLTQTLNSGSTITSTANIYENNGPQAFRVDDSVTYAQGLGTVNFQFATDGSAIDLSTLKLNYVVGSTTFSIAPINLISEYQAASGGGESTFSVAGRVSAQWDLTSLNISTYTLTFASVRSSNSFQAAALHTTDKSVGFREITPSTRAYSGAGSTTNWSELSNWAGNNIPVNRGNVTLSTGNGITVDSAREISLLTLNKAGAFNITATNGGTLQLNTGITADPTAPAQYQISAPVTIGVFNVWQIGANADVTITGPLSGRDGFFRTGEGTLRLNGSANHTFSGTAIYDGGTTYVDSSLEYTGETSITGGTLLVKRSAFEDVAGPLGKSSEQILLGSSGTGASALLIDGAHTIARDVLFSDGTGVARLGGQNTGAGATYSGDITVGGSGGYLHAVGASDIVNFTGSIDGGSNVTVTQKTGAGVVNFSGNTKFYEGRTIVAEGALRVASGSTMAPMGNVEISSNATFLVHGNLSGTGSLLIAGGTVGGSGTISRSFTLDAGDILSPGDRLVAGSRVGKLSTVGQTWSAGGRLHVDIKNAGGVAGTGFDTVDIVGTLALSLSAASKLTIEVATLTATGEFGTLSDFVATNNYSWQIVKATSITGFNPAGFDFDLSGFANANTNNFSVALENNALVLKYFAVPEPGAASLLMLGLAGMHLWRRTRRA